MAQTLSTMMMALGAQAPDFNLPDSVSGNSIALNDVKSNKATVVMFISNHCPFVKHVKEELAKLSNDYLAKGIAFVAIGSNDVEKYPDDAPEEMKKLANELGFRFPYLYDETQDVARAYHAVCTPDFFIFDGDLKCIYRGQLDGSRPGNNIPVTGKDIRAALNAVVSGEKVNPNQLPSIGCNIKWKD
jgi:peroxiredoxin